MPSEKESAFRVGYFDRVMHPIFIELINADPALSLVPISLNDPEDRALAKLASCHGYYVMSARNELPMRWQVTEALLKKLPKLLLVASYGAGYDTVDVAACTAANVLLVNQGGGNAQGVAEHALGMMLTLLKRIPETHAAMRAGAASNREGFMGRELTGRTVGLIGLGYVGTRTAALLKPFGCRVLAVDPYLDAATCTARGAEKRTLDEVLAESDIVSVHCPLSDETRGMLNAAAFATMRPGAILITTARGGIHDEGAVFDALKQGKLAGAGLDVWETEPPAADHPLLSLPTVIASQHTGGVTHESRERVARMAADAFALCARGEAQSRMINPQVEAAMTTRWKDLFGHA